MPPVLKKVLITLVCLCVLPTAAPALDIEVGDVIEVPGVIEERGWAKTSESYCQGGSEYYVLTTADGSEIVLNAYRDPIHKADKHQSFYQAQKDLQALVGQNVMVSGRPVSANWEENEHCPPGSQCPLGGIGCHWLRVMDIKIIK